MSSSEYNIFLHYLQKNCNSYKLKVTFFNYTYSEWVSFWVPFSFVNICFIALPRCVLSLLWPYPHCCIICLCAQNRSLQGEVRGMRALRDELDCARERAARAEHVQSELQSCKHKLRSLELTRTQLKVLTASHALSLDRTHTVCYICYICFQYKYQAWWALYT